MEKKKQDSNKKPVPKAPAKPREVKALVLHETSLTTRQTGIVNAPTPKQAIKSKPGRGGKKVTYIEGGYVISRLNEAFSPLGWEFRITERGTTDRKNEKSAEGEVWVYGELTIIDHKNGFRVTKGQYGQHAIHEKVPIGDAYKAAGTDALKKCASLLGIGLDVYWGTLDIGTGEEGRGPSDADLFERAKTMVSRINDMGALFEYREKLKNKEGKLTDAQRSEMITLVDKRLAQLDAQSEG